MSMNTNTRTLLLSSLAAACLLGLAACDSDPGDPDPTAPATTENPPMNEQSPPGSDGDFNQGDPPRSSGGN